MKGKLILRLSDREELFDYNFYRGIYPFDYEIFINTDLSDDFASLISDSGDLDDSMAHLIETSDDADDINFYKQCRAKKLELLKNAEYVTFGFNIATVAKYIKDNPILKTKKIVFTDIFDLDPKIIKEIEKYFGSETSSIYFDVVGNPDLISFKEYRDTVKVIDTMVQDIKRFDFSPLETIMYAYDLVRNRVYDEVGKGDDKMNSRGLSSVLLGDKIVCVGYARVFRTLLEKLGISCREVHLYNSDKTSGHARNEIYVQDEKYGVDGVYYFDPTWDNQKEESDNTYLSSYRFFGMTKSVMDSLDDGKISDEAFPYFSANIVREFEKVVDKKGFAKLPPKMLKAINHMSVLIYGKLLINKVGLLPFAPKSLRPNKNKIIEELIPLVEYFDKPLSADIMLKVLYNVRKNQYYSDPRKYSISLNEFFQIIMRSGWVFDDDSIFSALLSGATKKQKAIIIAHQLKDYSESNGLDKNIEEVKLAKVLRLIYEKKKSK